MMNVPYIGPIEGVLTSGYTIRVCGHVLQTALRFAINLQCGPGIYPRDDVALHFSPDFTRNCVVRNNILHNSWGPEEFEGIFPFARGTLFEIIVLCQEDSFKIAVNGQHFSSFIHRIPYSKITHIAIDGDITLSEINYSGFQQQYGFQIPQVSPYPAGPPGPYPPQPHHYPVGQSVSYPVNPTPYMANTVGYPRVPSPVPPTSHPGLHIPPGYMEQGHNLYPTQPGQPRPVSPYGTPKHQKSNLMDKAGMALAGGLGGGLLGTMVHGKKGLKINKKAQKKALKYGLPIAGVGLGAYALKKGFRGSSSSSSDSS